MPVQRREGPVRTAKGRRRCSGTRLVLLQPARFFSASSTLVSVIDNVPPCSLHDALEYTFSALGLPLR